MGKEGEEEGEAGQAKGENRVRANPFSRRSRHKTKKERTKTKTNAHPSELLLSLFFFFPSLPRLR
jgi:hypothetical protein